MGIIGLALTAAATVLTFEPVRAMPYGRIVRDDEGNLRAIVEEGDATEQERAIQLSNVALVCATCGPVRIGHEVRGDRKVRVCKKCGTTLDK